MRNVKNILFKFELDGHGIVNFDSSDQKFIWLRQAKKGYPSSLTYANDNVKYAKKNYIQRESGELGYKIKISSASLKHGIFKNDMVAPTPSIQNDNFSLNCYIGSFSGLVRGYTFAGRKQTLNRKGCVYISSAVQTCNAKSMLETRVRSGEKESHETIKDTSLFAEETIGDIKYAGHGSIDLKELQFVSCDSIFDRYGFDADNFDLIKEILNNTLGSFDGELAYHLLKTSSVDMGEYGFSLSNENVVFLVKGLLNRILSLNIQRASAFAKMSSLKIKLVSDPIKDTFESEDNWIEIKTQEDINSLDFDMEVFYDSSNSVKLAEIRERIEAENKKRKEEQAKAKEEKEAKKKAKSTKKG